MLSIEQLELLKSNFLCVTWLFKITDINEKDYYFSNKDTLTNASPENIGSSPIGYSYTETNREYTNNILNFNGISLRRNSSEVNMQTPDDLEFEIDNSNNVLTVSRSVDTINYSQISGSYTKNVEPQGSVLGGGEVELILKLNDIYFYTWRFKIIRADFSQKKTIQVKCKDFLQSIVDKTYPEILVSDLFGENTSRGDQNNTIPVMIGKSYLSLCPVFFSETETLYLLGLAKYNYTIHKARSPRAYGTKFEFQYFGQITKTGIDGIDYKFAYATVESDGTYSDNVLWQNGDRLHEMPFQVSRSDTENITNPADWIRFVLLDIGISETDVDSFYSAQNIFTTRGLEWNGGYSKKYYIKDILADLQRQCQAQLISAEKIKLEVLSTSVIGEINKGIVYRAGNALGDDTFNAQSVEYEEDATCGYVAYQEDGEPPDVLIKALVPCEEEKPNPSGSILNLPFITNSIHAQKTGKLHFQLMLQKTSEINFIGQPENIAFLPNSVLVVNETDYGGTYEIMVDQVKISDKLKISMQCIRFLNKLESWDDLSYDIITPVDFSDNNNSYNIPVVGGKVSYSETNILNNINYTLFNSESIKSDNDIVTNGGLNISKNGITIYSLSGVKLFEINIVTGATYIKP